MSNKPELIQTILGGWLTPGQLKAAALEEIRDQMPAHNNSFNQTKEAVIRSYKTEYADHMRRVLEDPDCEADLRWLHPYPDLVEAIYDARPLSEATKVIAKREFTVEDINNALKFFGDVVMLLVTEKETRQEEGPAMSLQHSQSEVQRLRVKLRQADEDLKRASILLETVQEDDE